MRTDEERTINLPGSGDDDTYDDTPPGNDPTPLAPIPRHDDDIGVDDPIGNDPPPPVRADLF